MVLQEALRSDIYKVWIDFDIVECIYRNFDNIDIIRKLHTVYDIDEEGMDEYIQSIRSLPDDDMLLLYKKSLEQESELRRNKMDFGVAQVALDEKLKEINSKINNFKNDDKD